MLEQTTLPTAFPLVQENPLIDSAAAVVLGASTGDGLRFVRAHSAGSAATALDRELGEGGTLLVLGPWVTEGVRRGGPGRAALTEAGRCFYDGRHTSRVALTFDDGPDPVYTRQVVEILERYGARATFFCVLTTSWRCPTRYGGSTRPATSWATTPGRTLSCPT
ncbi:hypothetical protein SMICM17S_00420 [Streptomyces microflavus]